MGYAKHIGRVGALAVALGVGIGMSTVAPGLATAAPQESETTNDVDRGGAESNALGGDDEQSDTPDPSPATDGDDDADDAASHLDESAISEELDAEQSEPVELDSADIDVDESQSVENDPYTPLVEDVDPAPNPLKSDPLPPSSPNPEPPANAPEPSDAPPQQLRAFADDTRPDLSNSAADAVAVTEDEPGFSAMGIFVPPTTDSHTEDIVGTVWTAPVIDSASQRGSAPVVASARLNPLAAVAAIPFRVINTLMNALGLGPSASIPVAPVTLPPFFELVIGFFRRVESTLANKSPVAASVQTVSGEGPLSGTVLATDPDNDRLQFSIANGPSPVKGAVTLNADGSFTYTPTEAFRRSGGQDSFVVTISDATNFHRHRLGSRHAVTATVVIEMTATNTPPVVDTANPTSTLPSEPGDPPGSVRGRVNITDAENDSLLFTGSASTPKGSVVVSEDGTFLYVPTEDARHNAATTGAGPDLTTDTFTVTATDGHGGTTTVPVAVSITAINAVADPMTATGEFVSGTDGVVTGMVSLVDPDGDEVVFSGSGSSRNGATVVVDPDGTVRYLPTAEIRHRAASEDATLYDRYDEYSITADDGHGGIIQIPLTISVTGANQTASSGTVTPGLEVGSDGWVSGTVTVVDPDGDTIRYSAPAGTSKGSVSVDATTGVYVYVPFDESRHDAAATGAESELTTDTFTITARDGHGGTTSVPITVTITPANGAASAGTYTTSPAIGPNGEVRGQVRVDDPDYDTITYFGSTTTDRGSAVVGIDGSYTYTPTPEARHAASAVDADSDATVDTFTVTASDGHGGITKVVVTVEVTPANQSAASGIFTPSGSFGPNGEISGGVVVVDPDGDTVAYTPVALTSTKGTLVVAEDGTYVYTPTASARHAAATIGADTAVTTDTFTVVATDGHGGQTLTTVIVSVAPANDAPEPGGASFGLADAEGVVSGAFNVTDPDSDTLTYQVTGLPTKGTVSVADGSFTYTPYGAAQLAAYDTPGEDVDAFTVTVTDGHGGTVDIAVEGIPVTPAIVAVTHVTDDIGKDQGVLVAAVNGKYYQTVAGGAAGAVRILQFDPADPDHPTTILAMPGDAPGGVYVGSDGVLYLSGSTTDGAFVAVINPADPTHPFVVNLGGVRAESAVYAGQDGQLYVNTSTGTSNNDYEAAVVRIDPADPTHLTVFDAGPGRPVSQARIADDGTIYLTTSTNPNNIYGTLSVARIGPDDPAHPAVFLAGTGTDYGLQIGPDGTLYQYLGNSGGQYSLAVLNQLDPKAPTVVTFPAGGGYSNARFAADGTAYLSSYSSENIVITIIDPRDPAHPAVATLPRNGNLLAQEILPDGTAYVTQGSYVNDGSGRYSDYVVTVVNRDGTTSSPINLSGNVFAAPVYGTGGTRYQLSYTYGQTDYMVSVIDPDDTAHAASISLSGVPVGKVVTGADGTAYLALTSVAQGGGYTTPVLVFTADDPYHPQTVALTGNQVGYRGMLVTTDGSAFLVTSGGTEFRLNVLSSEDPIHPITLAPQGRTQSALVAGGDGVYYLTYDRSVAGTATTYLMRIDLDSPLNPTTTTAGAGNALTIVQVGSDGMLYQVSETGGSEYHSYLTIVDPDDFTHPTVVDLGRGRVYPYLHSVSSDGVVSQPTVRIAEDGTRYVTTYTGGTTSSDITRLVRITVADPTHPTVISIGSGAPSGGGVQFGADGRVYQASVFTTGAGNTVQYTTTYAILDPSDPTHPTAVVLPGTASYTTLTLGPNGAAYLFSASSTQTGSPSAYTNFITVVKPDDAAHPTTVTLPGQRFGDGSSGILGPDGRYYVVTSSATSTPGLYEMYLTRFDSDDPGHPTTAALGALQNAYLATYSYYDSASLGSRYISAINDHGDVTLNVTTSSGNSGIMTVDETFAVVSAATPTPAGHVTSVALGTDGTSLVARYDSSTTTTHLTVIDPDEPAGAVTADVPGYAGSVLLSPKGTAYVPLGATYENSTYVSKIIVFDPADLAHPVTLVIPGFYQSLVMNDDGSAEYLTHDLWGALTVVHIETVTSLSQSIDA